MGIEETKPETKALEVSQEVIAVETEIVKQCVHAGFICDGCEVGPIIGTRFKCFQCPNFDLCEKCEPHHHRHHIMLRIPDSKVLETLYTSNQNQCVHEIHIDVPVKKTEEKKTEEKKVEETLPDLYQEKDLKSKIKNMKSNKGDTSIMMKMRNNSKKEILTVWVDYKGGLKHYANIKPGKMCNQQTYITHQWLIGDVVGPFAAYKPMMSDVSQLDYVSIVVGEDMKVTVEEVQKKVEEAPKVEALITEEKEVSEDNQSTV